MGLIERALYRPSRFVSIRGHHILAELLHPEAVVFDLGAHAGEFSHQVSTRFGCCCFAVEANPGLYETIPVSDRVKKIHAAICGVDGPISLTIDANLEGSHLSSDGRKGVEVMQVPGRTLPSLQAELGIAAIDLLKVDIEGAEFELFESLSDAALAATRQITIEFHDFIEELKSCAPKVAAVKQRLVALGFSCSVFSFRTNGDVLFINRRYYDASRAEWLYIERVAPVLLGIERVVRRRFAASV